MKTKLNVLEKYNSKLLKKIFWTSVDEKTPID